MSTELELVMAFARDRQQHLGQSKLSDPDPWMLATYAFDLQRRQNYLYIANRMGSGRTCPEHWPQNPRQLLNEILNHNKFVDDAAVGTTTLSSADWEARARMLERIIRHQAHQIWDDTHDVLTAVFGVRDDPGTPLTPRGDLEPLPEFVDYVDYVDQSGEQKPSP